MLTCKSRIAAAFATVCLLTAVPPAQAGLNCNVSTAAGKPVPVTSKPDTKRFRIFWHIATQIEEIADAGKHPGSIADIDDAGKLVDGYYFAALLGGPLIYWPDRPRQCVLNFKRIEPNAELDLEGATYKFEEGGAGGRAACLKAQSEFLAKQDASHDTPAEIQSDALLRTVNVLGVRRTQREGKQVWGELLIRNTDFSYDKGSDTVQLNNLPSTYCALNAIGLTPNGFMIYQEPTIQTKRGVFLWIPHKNRKGRLVFSDKAWRDAIPWNARVFSLLASAFEKARVPATNFRANIRRWNTKRSPEMAKELAGDPDFGGFNFEGGSRIISDERNVIDNIVEGVSWILTNTDRDVSFLMPGYWTRADIGTTDEIDTLIPRIRSTILALNAKLGKKLGLANSENAICNSRLVFIPASYGQPIHVRTLPMRRNGHLAGTVTGQIRLLSDIRNELCRG